MKSKFAYAAGVSGLLILQGCASGGHTSLDNLKSDEAIIFGKVTVVDEKGRDMSDSCDAARANVGENNLVVQRVPAGEASLQTINCNIGQYQYSIRAEGLTTQAQAGAANYFGNVLVSLSPANAYSVKVEDKVSEAKAALSNNALPVKTSLLKASGDKSWSKFFKGGRF